MPRSRPLRGLHLLLLLPLLGSVAACTPDATTNDGANEPEARWKEHDCAMPIPPGLAASDFRCGTLTVPESWEDPTERTVTVEVAVRRAITQPAPAADPFVFFGGGPAQWSLRGYVPAQITTVLAPIAETRDIVFFDPRGVDLSKPNLPCPEYDDAFLATYAEPNDNKTDGAALLEALEACHQRLLDEDIDPSQYHSTAVAHDVAALLDALGYDSANLYGISYGARPVQAMMRDFPEKVRSAILDSPIMPEKSMVAGFPANFVRAVGALADACAASDTCAANYPDLRGMLVDAIALLDADPHASPVTLPDGSTGQVYVTGGRLALGVQSALFQAELIPAIPLVLSQVLDGQNTSLDAFAPALVPTGTGIDWGQYTATLCTEVLAFDTPESIAAAREGLDPHLADPIHDLNAGYLVPTCDAWNVDPRPARDAEPVISDIPTLIFSGEFDPSTPPSNGKAAETNLANSQRFLFSGLGHGILRSDPHVEGGLGCAHTMVDAFLTSPMAPIDSSCLADLPSPF